MDSDAGAGGAQGGGGGGGASKPYSREELHAMRPRQLRALLAERGLSAVGCFEKADLVKRLMGEL